VPIALISIACLSLLATSHDGPVREAGAAVESMLPVAPESTTSLGHPFYGRLRDGIRMPAQGPNHKVQRSTIRRDWVYGTGYLVRGMLLAAAELSRLAPDGEPLVLGNLSRRGGGDISMSMSHNSGRDVDIAYYTADLRGNPVASEYHRFRSDGRSRKAPNRLTLDVPRNWAAVKAFMTSTEFDVQWVIVAPHIEALLLEHARAAGEPADLIARAADMMMQPSYAKVHDNHIHLRVLCSPNDWRRGCDNGGPVWPWSSRMIRALDEVRTQVAPSLRSLASATRITALKQLQTQGISTAVPDIAPLLSDSHPKVRRQAQSALVALTTEANAATILKITRWSDPALVAPLIERALPLAGDVGVAMANELIAEHHPVMATKLPRSKRKALLKVARKVLKQHR